MDDNSNQSHFDNLMDDDISNYNNDENLDNMDDNQEEQNNSVGSYNEDEDFPIFANRINKKLNEIIKQYKKEIRNINTSIEEDKNMVRVLDEHIKSVEIQLKNKQMILDQTKAQIDAEKHSIQSMERQVGKLKNQRKILEDREAELQERLNSIIYMINASNEKMNKFKLEMQYKQDELEQWALAARQKEDDNLSLEKYKRQDELRIKELMLHIERLTVSLFG